MKICIQLILLLSPSILYGQLLDGSFEKWDTAYYWVSPENSQFEIVPQIWASNNEIHPDWNPFLVSTPATISVESPFNDFSVKLESTSTIGIDEGGSGILYQDIPTESLSEISYWMKCDSLTGISGCIAEVLGISAEPELIFRDSISVEQQDFEQYHILVSELSSIEYDSIRLQFRAVGNSGLTSNPLGHTRMFIDEVDAKYSSGIFNVNEAKAKIYPNPVRNKLTVEPGKTWISKIELLDIYGRVVTSKIGEQGFYELEIIHEPQGLYIIKIEFINGETTIRPIVKTNP